MYTAPVMQPTDILDDCAVVLLSLCLSVLFPFFFFLYIKSFKMIYPVVARKHVIAVSDTTLKELTEE